MKPINMFLEFILVYYLVSEIQAIITIILNTQGGTGVPKPPRAPEKPIQPYMRYSKKVWDSVRNQNPDFKLWEIGKMIGQMWKELPDFEKAEFQDEYEVEKQQYDKDLHAYKTSPGYVSYIQAKCRGNPVIEDPEPKGVRTAERRIDIQPAEDEEDPDDGLSVKHIAHGRFTRNHRLINEVFSETMVPDVRSVVTTARMQVLKRQVQSLTMHQKKLEAELTQIEEKYNQKKRKFLDSSEDFSQELKKHCAKVVDENKYNEMVKEQLEKLQMEREERARAGAPTPPSPTPPTDPADTRHVLQPVERGPENPDSPQDENKKSEEGKEKDDKVNDSSKDMNGDDEKGNASTDDKNGDKEASNDTNNQPEDPPLQYADMTDMSNQKSQPTQPQAQVPPPFGQTMQMETASQQQPMHQDGQDNMGMPIHQAQVSTPVSSSLPTTADSQIASTPPMEATPVPVPSDSQPLAPTIAPQMTSQPTNDIPKVETPTSQNAESISIGETNASNKTEISATPETNQSLAVPSSIVESAPESTVSGTQAVQPPPVQGIPPSYPLQHQGNVPHNQPPQQYGLENNPFGTTAPATGANYPQQGYGGQYPNYTTQQGPYPPSSDPTYAPPNAPSHIEPMETSQNPPVASENTSNAAAAVPPPPQPSEANIAPPAADVKVPIASVDNASLGESNVTPVEKTLEAEKPVESSESTNVSSESTNEEKKE